MRPSVAKSTALSQRRPIPISIRIGVHGTKLTGALDGKWILDYELKEPVSGKVGLWSKTDSMSEFDAFTVTPAAK